MLSLSKYSLFLRSFLTILPAAQIEEEEEEKKKQKKQLVWPLRSDWATKQHEFKDVNSTMCLSIV